MRFASWRLVEEILTLSNVVLELVDSRDPLNTRCPKLERLAAKLGRPVVVVINKADLVPRPVCEAWVRYFREVEGLEAVYISAQRRLGTRVLRGKVVEVAERAGARDRIVVSVFGVPKVGKSTLVNTLKGRHSATTSPYPGTPGYTVKARLYRIGGRLYLVDTPGVLPPEGGGVESLIRSKPVDELDNPIAVAAELVAKVLKYNPKAFEVAYGTTSASAEEILAYVAKRRGWVRGGEPDLYEAAKALIRDYLDGKIVYYYEPPVRPPGSPSGPEG